MAFGLENVNSDKVSDTSSCTTWIGAVFFPNLF